MSQKKEREVKIPSSLDLFLRVRVFPFSLLLHSFSLYRTSQLAPASEETHTLPKKIPATSFCPEAEPAIEYQSVAVGAPPLWPAVVVPPLDDK